MPRYKQEWVKIANDTSRSGGFVGEGAIVPQYVEIYAAKKDSILDYGAGRDALHTLNLQDDGFDIVAYDFGDNVITGLHDENALEYQYDVVMASNVLNVQSTWKMLCLTAQELLGAIKPKAGSFLLANYPNSPRKSDMSGEEVLDLFEELAGDEYILEILEGGGSAPVFRLVHK